MSDDLEEKVNQSTSDKGVCRTAPATLGMLITQPGLICSADIGSSVDEASTHRIATTSAWAVGSPVCTRRFLPLDTTVPLASTRTLPG